MSTQNTQSTAKHTAGPWHLDTRPDSSVEIQDTNAVPVAVLTLRLQRNANARLIAAAPDLLAALEQVLDASEDNGDMSDIDWNGIRAAIARAKGAAI